MVCLILDPALRFFWYAAVGCLLLGLIAFAGDLLDKREARRARWEARDLARLARLSDPARAPGKPQKEDGSSVA